MNRIRLALVIALLGAGCAEEPAAVTPVTADEVDDEPVRAPLVLIRAPRALREVEAGRFRVSLPDGWPWPETTDADLRAFDVDGRTGVRVRLLGDVSLTGGASALARLVVRMEGGAVAGRLATRILRDDLGRRWRVARASWARGDLQGVVTAFVRDELGIAVIRQAPAARFEEDRDLLRRVAESVEIARVFRTPLRLPVERDEV
jgi:hypothetical protein